MAASSSSPCAAVRNHASKTLGGNATPCTYVVNGKQSVVLAAGGGGTPRTKTGHPVYAFALP